MGLLSRLPLVGRFFRGRDAGPTSLVMLLDREPTLGVVEVDAAVRHAFPDGLSSMMGEIPGPPGGPAGASSTNFMFSVGKHVFGVLVVGSAYMPDQASVADGIPREDIAGAVRNHRGWVAIDSFGPVPQNDAHMIIGRVAASLEMEGCLALYMPHRERFSFLTPTLRDAMFAGDWIDAFDEIGSDALVSAAGDDEALRKAAEEARARFPEFAAAFETEPESEFSVKSAFEENGETEHMWVSVEELLPSGIRGVLGNEPRTITTLRAGDEITVALDDMEDWMILSESGMRGGFSVRVLQPEMYRQMTGGA